MHNLGTGKTICIISIVVVATSMPLRAQTFTTLLDFNQADGDRASFVIQGNDGNLYGTTMFGGSRFEGTIFKYAADGTLSTLYNFCSRRNCADGSWPINLFQLADGSFVGITLEGGMVSSVCGSGCGTVFRFTSAGALQVLHTFCTETNCTDGGAPTGLIQGIDGKFYGTTAGGGAYNSGTVFSLTPSGKFTLLYSFCAQTSCPDGQQPGSGVIQANNGILYGTTTFGGTNNDSGTIFQITTAGKFTSLYSFPNNFSSAGPNGLIQGADGNLYGTSSAVGNGGTAFQFTLKGKYTVLHTFCQTPLCYDGSSPNTALVQGSDGRLYGTTVLGGAKGDGTIFTVTRTGGFSVIHSFCSNNPCTEGFVPSPLMQDTTGVFYGLTQNGGLGYGAFYSVDLGLKPFVRSTSAFGKIGMNVGILGNNLTGSSGVTFNGTSAAFTVVSDTYITATVPSGATTGNITVTTPSGTLSSNVPFRVLP